MGCRQQGGPSAWSRFESEWPTPGDQVIHEARHLVDLSEVDMFRVEPEPSPDIREGSKKQVGVRLGRNPELHRDGSRRSPAEKSQHQGEAAIGRQVLG